LLVANVDWVNMLQPPKPKTQPASLQIKDAQGRVLARQELVVLGPADPNTRQIRLYWTVSGAPDIVQPQTRQVINTPHIATRALEELLWGPPATSQVGFRTAIPMSEEIMRYPGRQLDWGPRVTLRSLVIENGVATADFSKEMNAYGGGSLRVKMIREQITQTLTQFPSVREVRIAVEGQTEGVLEP
jgi:spore germination protein GerM